MKSTKKWYAVYTKPRWEKKVNSLLSEKGYVSYCPLNKVKRRWSDRIKTLEEPLFKSYVFIFVNEEERTEIRMTPGVINFVYWNGKPAVIKEKEIATIKRFLSEHENVQVKERQKIRIDQRVRVAYGSLLDHEGTVLKIKNREVQVSIDSLGYVLVAYIARNKLVSVPSL